MFKNFKVMMLLYCFSTADLQASLQIAIPMRDFRIGNSLVLIARDRDGQEQVAGCVSFNDGKTQFSQEEISVDKPTMLSIAEQESSIISVIKHDQIKLDDDSIVYLYFEVDPSSIVRVLVIKNNFFADNPFDVVEFSAVDYLTDADDDDDCFDCFEQDEMSQLNLENIQQVQPVELSHYDKMLLAFYAAWAIQSTKIKQTYKNIAAWIASHYAK